MCICEDDGGVGVDGFCVWYCVLFLDDDFVCFGLV